MMKTLFGNQKRFVLTLATLLIVFSTQVTSYGQEENAPALNVGEPRTVRLFYFLANDRPYRQEVVDAIKTAILEVQSFYREQMEAHGHGAKTFQIETDVQGTPIVHRVDDLDDSGTANELHQMFDLDETIYLVVWDQESNNGLSGIAARESKIKG